MLVHEISLILDFQSCPRTFLQCLWNFNLNTTEKSKQGRKFDYNQETELFKLPFSDIFNLPFFFQQTISSSFSACHPSFCSVSRRIVVHFYFLVSFALLFTDFCNCPEKDEGILQQFHFLFDLGLHRELELLNADSRMHFLKKHN